MDGRTDDCLPHRARENDGILKRRTDGRTSISGIRHFRPDLRKPPPKDFMKHFSKPNETKEDSRETEFKNYQHFKTSR